LIIGRSDAAIRVHEHAGFVAIECASRSHGWLQPLVLCTSMAGNGVFNGGMGSASGSHDGSRGRLVMRESGIAWGEVTVHMKYLTTGVQ
jgi:hypothetical protein